MVQSGFTLQSSSQDSTFNLRLLKFGAASSQDSILFLALELVQLQLAPFVCMSKVRIQ